MSRDDRASTSFGLVVGPVLKGLRKSHQLTQTELAARAGLTEDSIRRVELVQNRPSVAMLAKLAPAFNMSLADLLTTLRDAIERPIRFRRRRGAAHLGEDPRLR